MTFEAALLAAFLAGFLGSTHCVGMCGAIVVLFEGGRHDSPGARLRRLSYNAGRGAFYVLLGVLAGLTGALLTKAVGVSTGLMLLRYLLQCSCPSFGGCKNCIVPNSPSSFQFDGWQKRGEEQETIYFA